MAFCFILQNIILKLIPKCPARPSIKTLLHTFHVILHICSVRRKISRNCQSENSENMHNFFSLHFSSLIFPYNKVQRREAAAAFAVITIELKRN